MIDKTVRLGITGTRSGFSTKQILEFTSIIEKGLINGSLVNISEFHHGDCIGVDFEACCIIRRLKPRTLIVSHPPIDPKFRAYFPSDVERKPKDYLVRNKDIVKECELLYVVPISNREMLRSGTWSTRRYAEKIGREFIILDR